VARTLSNKYSVSELCKFLGLNRSSVYYHPKSVKDEAVLKGMIKQIFEDSHNNYGKRKIRVELQKLGVIVSKRKISKLMYEMGLVSNYLKNRKTRDYINVIVANAENLVAGNFESDTKYAVVLSDLTFVRVCGKWCYLCAILDLFNREVIGWAIGTSKGEQLVIEAYHSIRADLRKIGIAHNDRGAEFTGRKIDELFRAFGITRSLSAAGQPTDNAPMESFYNIAKIDFIKNHNFGSIEEFRTIWEKYVEWYNNIRIHGSLGYLSPRAYGEKYGKAT
jgi:transposase InsO family protein